MSGFFTRRRIILLVALGLPAAGLLGLLVYVSVAAPPELERDAERSPSGPAVATWTGPRRPPAECPEFYARGRELFDMSLLMDQSTLDVEFHGRHVVEIGTRRVAVHGISFTSYEMDGCEVKSTRIGALFCLPVGFEGTRSGRLGGIVRAHGLQPHDEEKEAVELASSLQVAVLAFLGPGLGGSWGWDSRPDHFYDTASDARRSWLWAHAVGLMRSLTALESRPEVDPERLGVMGFSAGGMAALIAAGIDPRVKASVVWSAAGYLDLAVRAEPVPGWQVALLQSMDPPRTADSPEWQGFLRTLDPKNFLAGIETPVFLLAGAQDQYYPIHATARTYRALREGSDAHRLYVQVGFDHGPIANQVIDEVWPDLMANARFWFGHHLDPRGRFNEMIPTPEIASITEVECCPKGRCRACAEVRVAPVWRSGYEIDEVELQVSTDSARSFVRHPARGVGRRYSVLLEHLDPEELEQAVYFLNVVYRPLGEVQRIRVSSDPHIPDGFVPRIWPDARRPG